MTFLKVQLARSLMVLAMLMGLISQAYAINQSNPETMVKEVSEQLLKELELQRAELEGQPQKIKVFAEQFVLPYVDTPKMARYVMGRYWKIASEKQQQAFTEAFTQTLMRSYASSILKLKVTSVVVKPMIEEKEGRVQVPSEVTQADGNVTGIVYRAYLNAAENKWFLYDVSIEGISMLLNYRKSYGSELDKGGIDQVINDMQAKNKAFLEAA
ncbi:MlaC/ttg2D family ABC transporter substrate-binding protein [Thiosulfativibrio zosterae]|uniref:Signal peptidase n=1 Tax=Thiosulfativibrio zosterae TaxID=2675053 RepID=A0A6F8PM98_9GAMM|nr:ABC transporter substrate-binding protein [Thiosulfativibrio zosterae]BBP43216.1 signal peptidase [Thiosulfativibrio zosterae]